MKKAMPTEITYDTDYYPDPWFDTFQTEQMRIFIQTNFAHDNKYANEITYHTDYDPDPWFDRFQTEPTNDFVTLKPNI